MTTTSHPSGRRRHDVRQVPAETLRAAVPQTGTLPRIGAVAWHQAREATFAAAARIPGIGARLDRPRTQPLRSGAVAMNRWWRGSYGSDAKPSSVGEIPWDYVEEAQDRVPFLGLREHWYPALPSRDLRNNQAVPRVMLGDTSSCSATRTVARRRWRTAAPTGARCCRLGRWVCWRLAPSPAATTA